MFIRKKIQLYFGDAPARFTLITAVASRYKFIKLDALKDIFDLSLEMVDYDKNSGFNLLSKTINPYWRLAMNALLEDPQEEFSIDDNHYADIALRMVKYMSANKEYVPPAGYSGLVINVALQIISALQSSSNTSHYGQDLSNNPGQVVHSP